MIKIKIISFFFLVLFVNSISFAKDPSKLISEIVNDASLILSSSDPVEAKIIKLNNIAETNVDIDGIGMYTLGKYRKNLNEDQKIKYKKLEKPINVIILEEQSRENYTKIWFEGEEWYVKE